MKPDLSIIIVTWNVRKSFEQCLNSIDKWVDAPFELFVIDNASGDSTRVFLENFKPQNQFLARYEVIYNNQNYGLSKAANMGMSRAQGEFILLLNPDTKLLGPVFNKMITVAKNRPRLGMLGFKIMNPSGKVQWSISRLPTLVRQIESRLGLWRPNFDYDQPQEVEQINASVALMPKAVLDEIGLWDDGFFIWFEENDFCKRAHNAGYKIYYSPEIQVMHESQAGISKIPMWKRQLIWQKSMFRYFRKHHGLPQAIMVSILDPACMMIGMAFQKIKKRLLEHKNKRA